MPTPSEIFNLLRRQEEDKERKAKLAAEAEDRRIEAKIKEDDRKREAEENARKVQRSTQAQQILSRFGVPGAIQDLKKVLPRDAKVEQHEDGTGLRVTWDRKKKDWPACVDYTGKEISVGVCFDDSTNLATGLYVGGISVNSPDGLAQTLAEKALHPYEFEETKWKKGCGPTFYGGGGGPQSGYPK